MKVEIVLPIFLYTVKLDFSVHLTNFRNYSVVFLCFLSLIIFCLN
jgi:hypothetical protein